jgi:hypothetical protein
MMLMGETASAMLYTSIAAWLTVMPAANSWTEFQVTDVDGRVQILAS